MLIVESSASTKTVKVHNETCMSLYSVSLYPQFGTALEEVSLKEFDQNSFYIMILNRLLAYFGKNDYSINKLITENPHKMHM